jgi:predicted nucleotidyltransferase
MIVRLFLFGSVARGEVGDDVDLVGEFGRGLSLPDLVGLENRLGDLPGARVEQEAAIAF